MDIQAWLIKYFLGKINCYEDNPRRVLQSTDKILNDKSMKIEKCQKFCFDKSYLYSGVQNTNQCFCGNEIEPEILKPSSECNKPCTGDSSQICGGAWRMNIYKNKGIKYYNIKIIFHQQKTKSGHLIVKIVNVQNWLYL